MTVDSSTVGQPELRAERGVAQYHRLASLLRHRIASGEYPLGAQLPPITQLAEDLGVAVVTVAQHLGHARASTTLNVYGHCVPGADLDAARFISNLIAAPQASGSE